MSDEKVAYWKSAYEGAAAYLELAITTLSQIVSVIDAGYEVGYKLLDEAKELINQRGVCKDG